MSGLMLDPGLDVARHDLSMSVLAVILTALAHAASAYGMTLADVEAQLGRRRGWLTRRIASPSTISLRDLSDVVHACGGDLRLRVSLETTDA